MICADRLGLTGMGGGGAGDSRFNRLLCSSLRYFNSWLSILELEEVLMALDLGSSSIGRNVKVSESSMARAMPREGRVELRVCGCRELVGNFGLRKMSVYVIDNVVQ